MTPFASELSVLGSFSLLKILSVSTCQATFIGVQKLFETSCPIFCSSSEGCDAIGGGRGSLIGGGRLDGVGSLPLRLQNGNGSFSKEIPKNEYK